jgi:hypothetical protein
MRCPKVPVEALSRHARAILELGIGYLVSVAVLELFLVKYEILAWAALGIAFVFFGLLIFNALLPLTNENKPGQPQIMERNEDETQRLGKLVRRVVQDGDQQATEALQKRLRSAALLIASYRTNLPPSQLDDLSKNRSVLSEIIRDERLVRLLTTDSSADASISNQEIEAILTMLEDWVV